MGAGKRNRLWQKTCKWVLIIVQILFTVWGSPHVPVWLQVQTQELWLSQVLIGMLPWRKAKRFWYPEFLSHSEVIDVIHGDVRWVVYSVWETPEGNTPKDTRCWPENRAFVISICKKQIRPLQGLGSHCQINGPCFLCLFFNSTLKDWSHSISSNHS